MQNSFLRRITGSPALWLSPSLVEQLCLLKPKLCQPVALAATPLLARHLVATMGVALAATKALAPTSTWAPTFKRKSHIRFRTACRADERSSPARTPARTQLANAAPS